MLLALIRSDPRGACVWYLQRMDSWISELESEVHEVEGELEDKVPKLTPGGGVMSTHDLLLSLRALRPKVDPAGPSLPGSGVVSCSRRCVVALAGLMRGGVPQRWSRR